MKLAVMKEKIKNGLRRAKARGKILGNPRLEQVRNSDLTAANQARVKNAEDFARSIFPHLLDIARDGISNSSEIVRELNRRGIKARRGGKWSLKQYQRLRETLEKSNDPQDLF